MADFNGDDNSNRITGTSNDDNLLAFGGNDFVFGGGGNDNIEGGDGDDFLIGSLGNDTIRGQNGNDLLVGTFGDDLIRGGAGDDTLVGAPGKDNLRGGAGADVFRYTAAFEGVDTILQFSAEEGDKIEISQGNFGNAPVQLADLNYDNATGTLSFKGNQLAILEGNVDFNLSRDIIIS